MTDNFNLPSSAVAEQVSGAVGGWGILTWIRGRSRSFVFHILMVVLVGLFMRLYVDGRQFFLNHTVALSQADGDTIYERVLQPVQRDITTIIISILASTARAASTLWLAWIDLRCIFLFVQRGGVSSEGLKVMFNKSLPGRGHFQKKTNLIILLALNLIILVVTYASSVLTGSVTWKPAIIYRPGQRVEEIPLALANDPIYSARDPRLLDSFIAYSTAIYIFHGNPEGRGSSSMHRLFPEFALSLSNASKFEGLTVPFFAVNAFEWIKDPNSTLSPTQMAAATVFSSTGPHVMNIREVGLIPDGNWGPSELVLPAPLTVAESRILVIMTGLADESHQCHLNPPIPDVQPYMTISGNLSCDLSSKSCSLSPVSGIGYGVIRRWQCQGPSSDFPPYQHTCDALMYQTVHIIFLFL